MFQQSNGNKGVLYTVLSLLEIISLCFEKHEQSYCADACLEHWQLSLFPIHFKVAFVCLCAGLISFPWIPCRNAD
jgi:hypothetical protein